MRQQPRILVADDQEMICEFISTFLIDEGCQVECATRGVAVRLALQGGRFDLAILDVLLPDELGLILAQHATGLGIPVILMSGNPAHMQGLDRTPYPSLRKPFRLNELQALMDAVLADGGRAAAAPTP